MNVINGGCHAKNSIDFQEFMIMPAGAETFSEGIQMCAEIYQQLKKTLSEKGYSTGVGDEGGFAPDLDSAQAALEILQEATTLAGYEPGEDIFFAMDAAALNYMMKIQSGIIFREKAGCGKRNLQECRRNGAVL